MSEKVPTSTLTPACIVVGTDGSERSLAAVEWAAAEAGRCQARLELHTAYPPGYEFATREDVIHGMQRLLDEARAKAAAVAPAVKVECFVHEDLPASALIAASEHADLLVVGNRGRSQVKELLLGSVSLHCVFNARCSVAVIRSTGPHP